MKNIYLRVPDELHDQVVARCQEENRPVNRQLNMLLEAWAVGQVELPPPGRSRRATINRTRKD